MNKIKTFVVGAVVGSLVVLGFYNIPSPRYHEYRIDNVKNWKEDDNGIWIKSFDRTTKRNSEGYLSHFFYGRLAIHFSDLKPGENACCIYRHSQYSLGYVGDVEFHTPEDWK